MVFSFLPARCAFSFYHNIKPAKTRRSFEEIGGNPACIIKWKHYNEDSARRLKEESFLIPTGGRHGRKNAVFFYENQIKKEGERPVERLDTALLPVRELYTGEKIPCMGLGTFGSDKYGAEQVSNAVYGAIRYGYRLIDCASVYQNEHHIGEVLQRIFQEGSVQRSELFITSKVWNDQHGEGEVISACKKSLSDLKLDVLDLYFVHWPFSNYHAPGCSGDSRNPDSRPFSVEEFMTAWLQCERLIEMGLVRHIGMSNMTVPKLEAVLPLCKILSLIHI
jgi:hypothetical protein